MENKVVLILVDGMRPDGVLKCGHPFAKTLQSISSWSMSAQTVMPSVTLCLYSIRSIPTATA